MDVLVDTTGEVWAAESETTCPGSFREEYSQHAILALGYVRIREVSQRNLVISLQPQLLRMESLVGTCFALADYAASKPGGLKISVVDALNAEEWEVLRSIEHTFRSMLSLMPPSTQNTHEMRESAPGVVVTLESRRGWGLRTA